MAVMIKSGSFALFALSIVESIGKTYADAAPASVPGRGPMLPPEDFVSIYRGNSEPIGSNAGKVQAPIHLRAPMARGQRR